MGQSHSVLETYAGVPLNRLIPYGELELRRSHTQIEGTGKMKIIYALFLAFLIASPVYAKDLKSDIAQESKAFAKAYNAHDFKTLGQLYAKDAVVYAQGIETTKGREAIQKLWTSFEKEMTGMKLEPLEVVDAGKHAIEYGKYTSTYKGQTRPRYIHNSL
jgi:ketosteroid isomerase-like protein